MAKGIIKNYSFNTSTKTITLTDITTVRLDKLALITDTTTNKILYNFADSTVATATVSTNVITLSTLQGGESNSDKLRIDYDVESSDASAFADTAVSVSVSSSSLPSGAATATKQSDGSQKTQVVDGSGNVVGAVTADADGTSNSTNRLQVTNHNKVFNGSTWDRQPGSTSGTYNIIRDAAGNARGANVNASNQLSVSVDNTVTVGAHNVTQVPATSGGLSISRTLSSASAGTATSVKGSAGQLFGWAVTNTNASARFLKLYNTSSTPTAGSGTPVMTLMIPGSASGTGMVAAEYTNGLAFSSGIGFTITGAVADNDTTAISANEVIVNLFYK